MTASLTTVQANASTFDRTRVQNVRLLPGEKRTLVANFNGAIPAGNTIASAQWRMWSAAVASMSGGTLATPYRQTSITLAAHTPGWAEIECLATLDNGDVYTQRFMVEVEYGYFGDYPTPAGQTLISLTAA